MSLTYLEHPHFSKSLRKLRDQGGQGKKMAEKVLSVLGGILRYEDPFSSIRKTHQGENRLKGGIKYALSDSFRLVTQQIGNNCIFVYVGSHDDTEKYLDANRGMTYLNGSDNQIIGKTFKTTPDTGQVNLEPQIQEGKIWDNLSSELDQFTSDFNLSRSQLNEIADLANGSSNSVIIDTLEKIKSNLSEQNEAINEKFTILTDVLIMLNSGDKVSAKNRIFEFDKKENDILDPELADQVEIKEISPEDKTFFENLEKYIKSSNQFDWLISTHPKQLKYINDNYPGPFLLSGVSGSGKTAVLIMRAKRILNQSTSKKILIATLNRALANLIDSVMKELLDDEEYDRLDVLSIFDLCKNTLRKFEPRNEKIYTEINDLEQHQEEIYREYYRCETNNFDADVMWGLHQKLLNQGIFAEKYIQEEFDWLRSFLKDDDFNSYLYEERRGRKIPFTENDRRQILEGLTGWTKKMKNVGCADQGFIVNSVLKYENKLSSIYDHSFVDEVQDLGVLELKLIRKITKIGENDLFLVGDRAQSILPKKSNLTLSGINHYFKKESLKLNYRNTKQVLEAAHQILINNLDDDLLNADHELEISDPDFSERIGPKPGLLKSKNLLEEIAFTHAFATKRVKQDPNLKICIVICNYTNYELQNYSNKFDFEFLDGKKVLSEKSIFISDLEQSKGFEFDLMFILNCNKDNLPPKDMPAEESYRIGCKLYVSMTRAKQELYLSYSSELSDWLNSQSILEKLDVNQEWHWHIDVDEHRSFLNNKENSELMFVPQRLPEVIDKDEEIDEEELFSLNGKQFQYTSHAVGMEKRLLNFLETLVNGKRVYGRVNNKPKTETWKNLGQLYEDLKTNKMLSNFPYYISEKADSEILEFLQNFEDPRISNKIIKSNNKKIEDIKVVEPAELNKGHPDYKEFLKLAYNPYEDK